MLENHWYIVALAKEIKNKPKGVSLFGIPLVVFEDGPGSVGVLEDRCPHRNAPLSSGKVCGQTIQCPYHGWEFDRSGALSKLPALGQSNLPKISVPAYSGVLQDGYVWVCLSNNPHNLKPGKFPFLTEKGWSSFKMQTLFNAPVEQCLENFLDCPHAAHVHDSWFRSSTGKKAKAVVRALKDGAEVEYFDEPREKSVVWWGLQNSKSKMQHTDRFIAPATSQVDYIFSDKKRYSITSCCTPINKEQTMVHTVISFKYGALSPLVKLFFKPLSKKIIKQDVDIMNLQRSNINKFGKEKFHQSKTDFLLPHILRWRRAIAQGTAPKIEQTEKHVEIIL